MKKFTFVFVLLLLFIDQSQAQDYSHGLILTDFSTHSIEELCCIYTPPDGFTVYDTPNGNKIGILKRGDNYDIDSQAQYKLYYINKSFENDLINRNYLTEVQYEVWAIEYTGGQNGYLKVMFGDDLFWINENEISQKNFTTASWQDYFYRKSRSIIRILSQGIRLDVAKIT